MTDIERRIHLHMLIAMALELKVILCVLQVDNLLACHDNTLWATYAEKRAELSFWRLVFGA